MILTQIRPQPGHSPQNSSHDTSSDPRSQPSTDGRSGSGGEAATIQRVGADASVSVHVDRIDGTELNAPNDICVDAEGGLWFSDPSWEFLDDGMAGPGSICLATVTGEAKRVHTGLRFPNGVRVAADGGSLLVTESSTGDVWTFPIAGAGELGEGRRFASLGADALPDGQALDVQGRVLVAGHGTDSVHVFGPDGTPEEVLPLGEGAGLTNLCFGGPDASTVFVTAANSGRVLSFEWKGRGLELHGR